MLTPVSADPLPALYTNRAARRRFASILRRQMRAQRKRLAMIQYRLTRSQSK